MLLFSLLFLEMNIPFVDTKIPITLRNILRIVTKTQTFAAHDHRAKITTFAINGNIGFAVIFKFIFTHFFTSKLIFLPSERLLLLHGGLGITAQFSANRAQQEHVVQPSELAVYVFPLYVNWFWFMLLPQN
jgi:hypothetical protein